MPPLRIDLIFLKDLKRRGRRDDGLLFIKDNFHHIVTGWGRGREKYGFDSTLDQILHEVIQLQQRCQHIFFCSDGPPHQDQWVSKQGSWDEVHPYLREVKKWLRSLQEKVAKIAFLEKFTFLFSWFFTCLVSNEHVHWLQICTLSLEMLSSLNYLHISLLQNKFQLRGKF